jgi:hypothetical protein
MGLFGKKQPKLPSYADFSLDGLRADPAWTQAITGAGLDIARCELVFHVGSAMVGTGSEPGSPHRAQPALLLGHGDTLAIVFPGEPGVRVVKRPEFKADLQTQRSGTFQILFAPVNQLDVWMFDDFKRGTPEGEQFGQMMLQFLRGQAAQPAHAPSPSSSASSMATSVAEPPAVLSSPMAAPSSSVPSTPNQDEETAHQLVHHLAAACSEVMRLHGACYEEGGLVQKAHYVASQPQAPASRANFLRAAERHEREFVSLLNELQGATTVARGLWSDFAFVSGGPDQGMDKLLMPLVTQGVLQGDEVSSIMVGGIFVKADFGSTMDSFFETDSRLAELMTPMGGE